MFEREGLVHLDVPWVSAMRETLKADRFVFFVPLISSFVTRTSFQCHSCRVVPCSFSRSLFPSCLLFLFLSLHACLMLRIRRSALFAQPPTLDFTFALYQERVIRIAYQVDSHLSLWLIRFFHLFMELSRIKDECHLLRWRGTHADDRSFIFICGRGRLLARRPPVLFDVPYGMNILSPGWLRTIRAWTHSEVCTILQYRTLLLSN